MRFHCIVYELGRKSGGEGRKVHVGQHTVGDWLQSVPNAHCCANTYALLSFLFLQYRCLLIQVICLSEERERERVERERVCVCVCVCVCVRACACVCACVRVCAW